MLLVHKELDLYEAGESVFNVAIMLIEAIQHDRIDNTFCTNTMTKVHSTRPSFTNGLYQQLDFLKRNYSVKGNGKEMIGMMVGRLKGHL